MRTAQNFRPQYGLFAFNVKAYDVDLSFDNLLKIARASGGLMESDSPKNPMKDKIDSFTRAYLECALWSSNDESDPSGGEPFDSNYSIRDFAPEAIEQAVKDCARFQNENAVSLAASELEDSRAGHNFWLNRNSHGSGFWDKYGPKDPRRFSCNALSDASNAFGEIHPYLGDDGKIYFA